MSAERHGKRNKTERDSNFVLIRLLAAVKAR